LSSWNGRKNSYQSPAGAGFAENAFFSVVFSPGETTIGDITDDWQIFLDIH
jgi:hypothetical protein